MHAYVSVVGEPRPDTCYTWWTLAAAHLAEPVINCQLGDLFDLTNLESFIHLCKGDKGQVGCGRLILMSCGGCGFCWFGVWYTSCKYQNVNETMWKGVGSHNFSGKREGETVQGPQLTFRKLVVGWLKKKRLCFWHHFSHTHHGKKTTSTWYPKHPLQNGCFCWMIPNVYLGNGCFTKLPLKNWLFDVPGMFFWEASTCFSNLFSHPCFVTWSRGGIGPHPEDDPETWGKVFWEDVFLLKMQDAFETPEYPLYHRWQWVYGKSHMLKQ